MSLTQQYAFVDESGGENLAIEKQGVTKHFALVAVLVDENSLSTLRQQVDALRQRYFPGGEIKSSRLNLRRRKKMLQDVSGLDFHFYGLVVYKDRIFKDSGLRFKKSFRKFICGRLCRRLFRRYSRLQIVADEHGREAFMDGFVRYMKREHQPDLFAHAEARFEDSEDEVLIQLADLLVGTLRKCHEDDAPPEMRKLLGLLNNQQIAIEDWPVRFEYHGDTDLDENDDRHDRLVRSQAINQAQIFIDEHEKLAEQDPTVAAQVRCARYLLFRYRFDDVHEYVPTHDLLNHLGKQDGQQYSEHHFRTNIIAKLRDAGVIIASSPKGYKLPHTTDDLYASFDHHSSMIRPMLKRLKRYRDHIKEASKNELDLFEKSRYAYLQRFFEDGEL